MIDKEEILLRPNRTMLVLQVVITCLVGALGIWALANGKVVLGLLLVALAAARAGMIVTRRRRRAEFMRRYRGTANRDRG